MQNYARLGVFGILALIGLRVGIGWHFFMEGAAKVKGGDFSSVGFLENAHGPLAGQFQEMIWDHDGKLRLNQESVNKVFEEATNRAAQHFGFTDEQIKELQKVMPRYFGQDGRGEWIGKLNDAYAEAAQEIFKYWESVERVEKMDEAPIWNEVASLRGQKERIERERMADVKGTLGTVDAIWKQYEGRLNSIATKEQRQQAGYFYIKRPGEGLMSTAAVDRIIPVFDMAVGILLILGLLTPVAAWAAAIFLISVVLSQMPGYPDTTPTYFQAVEALALIVLATSDAGRYAGLDFIPWAWWQNRKAVAAA